MSGAPVREEASASWKVGDHVQAKCPKEPAGRVYPAIITGVHEEEGGHVYDVEYADVQVGDTISFHNKSDGGSVVEVKKGKVTRCLSEFQFEIEPILYHEGAGSKPLLVVEKDCIIERMVALKLPSSLIY